jgi:hypothetical protein
MANCKKCNSSFCDKKAKCGKCGAQFDVCKNCVGSFTSSSNSCPSCGTGFASWTSS